MSPKKLSQHNSTTQYHQLSSTAGVGVVLDVGHHSLSPRQRVSRSAGALRLLSAVHGRLHAEEVDVRLEPLAWEGKNVSVGICESEVM